MKVLDVMLSEEAQKSVANAQDVLSHSQKVGLKLLDHLESVKFFKEKTLDLIRRKK